MTDFSALTAVELAVYLDPAHHVEWVLASGNKPLLPFGVRLMGWTAAETSGSAACTINIYDGADTSGSIVLPVKLASGQSSTDWYGPNGIVFRNGVTVSMGAGASEGSIFYCHMIR